MNPVNYLYLSALLFTIGAVGVLIRRNAIVVFMCVELMLNACNLAFVTFARMHGNLDGQIVAFFVMVVAAAEVVVGLAIIVTIFRTRRSASVDDANLLKLLSTTTDRRLSHDSRGGPDARCSLATRGQQVAGGSGRSRVTWLLIALPLLAPSSCCSAAAGPTVRATGSATLLVGARSSSASCCSSRCSAEPPRTARIQSAPVHAGSPVGDFQVDVGFQLDQLSMAFVLLITGRRLADPHLLARLHGARPATGAGSSAT